MEAKRARLNGVEWLCLSAIVLVAWLMRAFDLNILPPGIDRDTAQNGVYTLYILREGLRPLFYRIGAPEPLIIYLQSLSVAWLGVSVLALRIVTAVIGLLTVISLYVFARALKLNGRIAVIAAFGLAISVEHSHLSRLGLRAIMIPLFEMLALYFFWRGWRDGRARNFFLAGLALGVGYYTYLSAIFLPILVLAIVAHQFIFNRPQVIARWRGIALAFGVALIVALPLAVFEIIYPGAAFFRASQVTLLQNPDFARLGLIGAVAQKILSQAQMFGIRWEGQYNPLSQPLLDPFWFALLIIGLIICLRRLRQIEYAWALLAIVVMLLPDLIGGNEVFPQELRVIGIFPPTFFACAIGLHAAIRFGSRWQPRWATSIALALLVLSGANAVDTYLIDWNNLAQKTFDPNFDLTEVTEGKWIADATLPVFLPLNEYARQPVRYLAGARAPLLRSSVDANALNVLPSQVLNSPSWVVLPVDNARPRFEGRAYSHDPLEYVLVYGDTVYLLPPLQIDPTDKLRGAPSQEIRNALGGLDARAYKVNPSDYLSFVQVDPSSTRAIQLGRDITLLDASLSASSTLPGESLALTLWWRTDRRLSNDYTIFVHLLDSTGNVVNTADVTPALGAYPTFLWKPGELVPTHHEIKVPLRAAPGKYAIEIGMYNALDQNRLDVLDASGNAVDSRVIVGAIKVAPREAITYNPSHPQRSNFGNQIALNGYDIQPGNDSREYRLSFYWQGLATMDRDYTMFAHVLDESGKIIAQSDHQPQTGNYPTSIWGVGEQVRDDFTLTIPSDVAVGKYKIEVGWYDLNTGERLAVIHTNGDAVILDQSLEVNH